MSLTSNSNLLTTSKVTKETLMQLVNNLVLASRCDWSYSKEFGREAEQIGDTLSIRRPILTSISENSMTWSGALPFEGRTQLVVEKSFSAFLKFQDADLALKIEKFADRFIKQSVTMLANKIDAYVYGVAQNNAFWTVGQYNNAITSDTILAAKEYLDAMNCPDDGEIYGILTPKQSRNLSNAQLTLFNAQKSISEIYLKGRIGEFAGIDFAWSNSSPTHTDGTIWSGTAGSFAVSTPALTSGWAETSTVAVSGMTVGSTINTGDVFYLSGTAGTVKAYNPLTKATLPYNQLFVVTTSVASTVSAAQSVVISPALISSGDYQNVVDPGGVVNLVAYSTSGTTGQEGLVFHKKAIAIASPELVLPNNRDQGWKEEDDETGAKIRYLRAYDAANAYFVTRLDTFIGAKLARFEWVVRVR
jgi:hypothetical protein